MSRVERHRVFSFQDDHHRRYRWLLASPWRRVSATLLDAVLTAAAAAPAAWLLHEHFGDALPKTDYAVLVAYAGGSPWLMAAVSLWLLYWVAQIVLLAHSGQTFGKWLVGARIVRDNGRAAGFFRVWLMRSFVFWLLWLVAFALGLKLLGLDDNFAPYELLWIPCVLNFAMLFNLHDNNRTLQDKVAGTAVVERRIKSEF